MKILFKWQEYQRLMKSLRRLMFIGIFVLIVNCGGGGGGGGGDIMTPPPSQPMSDINPINPDYSNTRDYNLHYGLQNIEAASAYERGYFGQGVTIAIADDGFDLSHSDFAGRVLQGYNAASDNNEINTGDGSHGTFVALLAAGGRDNDGPRLHTITLSNGAEEVLGNFHGVAPSVSIIPIQLADARGRFVRDHRKEALQFAIDNGAQIINNSYGPAANILYGRLSNGDWWQLRKPMGELQGSRTVLPAGVYALATSTIAPVNRFDAYKNLIDDVLSDYSSADDVVYVWASGNESWRSGTTVQLCIHSEIQSAPYLEGNSERACLRLESVTQEEFLQMTISAIDNTLLSGRNIALGDFNINVNDPGGYAIYPRFNPLLKGKWLAVGAVDSDNNIASFSNGCGGVSLWCVMAPGSGINTGMRILGGTSFSAPIASGALAALKSRLPSMPMSVVLAILLTTATDLGETGVDEVYGWGVINLENAITLQSKVVVGESSSTRSASSDSSRGLRLADFNVNLPSSMSPIKDRLNKVQVAVSVVSNIHYNAPLADFINIESETRQKLGDAAKDILLSADNRYSIDSKAGALFAATDIKSGQFSYVGGEVQLGDGGRWRFQHNLCDDCKLSVWEEWNDFANEDESGLLPFFARLDKSYIMIMEGEGFRPFAAVGGDNSYLQYGARWKRTGELLGVLAELSQIEEEDSFMGAHFGQLGDVSAKTQKARLMLHADIMSDMRLFAVYEMGRSDVSVKNGGFLQGFEGARAEGWSWGISRAGILSGVDELRWTMRREVGLSGGRALFRHVVAGCDDGSGGDCFYDAFYGSAQGEGARQTLSERQTFIDIAADRGMIFALGYKTKPSYNSELSIGAEYSASESTALSLQWRVNFD